MQSSFKPRLHTALMGRPRTLPDNDTISRHLADGWTYQRTRSVTRTPPIRPR
jgi:hypothetical protein